jgi:hypothetical protein
LKPIRGGLSKSLARHLALEVGTRSIEPAETYLGTWVHLRTAHVATQTVLTETFAMLILRLVRALLTRGSRPFTKAMAIITKIGRNHAGGEGALHGKSDRTRVSNAGDSVSAATLAATARLEVIEAATKALTRQGTLHLSAVTLHPWSQESTTSVDLIRNERIAGMLSVYKQMNMKAT